MGDDTNKYDKLPQIIAGLGAAMGGFNTGTVFGWASGALPLIKKSRARGKEENPFVDAWIESAFNLGAIGSLVVTGFVINHIGRKPTLIIPLPLATAIWLITAFLVFDSVQIAMRLAMGLAVGVFSVVAPLYVGETTAKEVRGFIGFFFQLFLNLGILYSYIIALSEDIVIFNVMMILPIVIMFVWITFLPESPYFLISRGNEAAARDALQWLRGKTYNIDSEFQEIQSIVEKSHHIEKTTLSEVLRRKSQRRALLVGILLMSCCQFSGVDAVLFNLASIFEAINTKDEREQSLRDALLQSIVIGVVQVVATIPAMFSVDYLGRRMLMIASMSAMGVGQAMLFLYFILDEEIPGEELHKAAGWLPLAGLCVFIASFNIGAGPISVAMLGEIFTEDAKNVSAPLVVIYDFVTSFFVVWLFEYLIPLIPLYIFFLIYTVLCFVTLVVVILALPETKNRSFEEIQNILEGTAPDMAPFCFKK